MYRLKINEFKRYFSECVLGSVIISDLENSQVITKVMTNMLIKHYTISVTIITVDLGLGVSSAE